MILGIDGRSLLDRPISGIGEYTKNLLEEIFLLRPNNEYKIFLNSFKKHGQKDDYYKYPQENIYSTWIPNKILNSLLYSRILHLEHILGRVDHFFLPNHIFFALKKATSYTVTVHDLSFELFPQYFSIKGRLWHRFVHPIEIYKRAQKIIAVSENTKQDLIREAGIDENKIIVIYSGINKEFLTFDATDPSNNFYQKRYALPPRYILYLGTVEKRKNVIGIIRAFDFLKQQNAISDIALLIAGKPGFGFSKIYKMAQSSQYANSIKFLGYVDPAAKPYLYYRASCFVYPSFYEGFGFPPLEAMAVGTPTIVANSSSLVEIAGDAAVLVNPYNSFELASAINELLHNKRLADIISTRGKNLAQQYSWELCAKKTLQVLES